MTVQFASLEELAPAAESRSAEGPAPATRIADVAVIVLQFGKADETLRCLAALEQSQDVELDVIVVDNASPDPAAVPTLRDARPELPLIVNDINHGFAEGNNRILRDLVARWTQERARCASQDRHPRAPRFALLLNNDVELAPDCIAEMLQVAREYRAGAVGAINFVRGTQDCGSSGGRILLPSCRYIDEAELALSAGRPRPVDGIAGSTLLLDLEALAEVGVLDPDYFCVYEETDLCLRLRAAGHALYLVPSAHASHAVGASTGRRLHFYFRFRNRIRFARKHGGRFGLLRLLPSYARELIWKTGGYLLTGRFGDLCGVWRGAIDGLRGVTGPGPYLGGAGSSRSSAQERAGTSRASP
jgi:GT2 family glycosyltransferase